MALIEVDEVIEIGTPVRSVLPIYRSDVRDRVDGTGPWRRDAEEVVKGEKLRYVF